MAAAHGVGFYTVVRVFRVSNIFTHCSARPRTRQTRQSAQRDACALVRERERQAGHVACISVCNNGNVPGVWAESDGKTHRSVHTHWALCCYCDRSVMVGSDVDTQKLRCGLAACVRRVTRETQDDVHLVYLLHTRTIIIINKMRLCNLCTPTVCVCVSHVKVRCAHVCRPRRG